MTYAELKAIIMSNLLAPVLYDKINVTEEELKRVHKLAIEIIRNSEKIGI